MAPRNSSYDETLNGYLVLHTSRRCLSHFHFLPIQGTHYIRDCLQVLRLPCILNYNHLVPKKSTETNKKLGPQHGITRIQPLYHADKERTEQYILELAVWLHHLVLEVRNKGYGYRSMKPVRSKSRKGSLLQENNKDIPFMSNDKSEAVFELSEDDRKMLERVSSKRMVLGRSKSQELATDKGKRGQATRGLSRSFGNSSSWEFNMALEFHLERTKVLDILDGLDTVEKFLS